MELDKLLIYHRPLLYTIEMLRVSGKDRGVLRDLSMILDHLQEKASLCKCARRNYTAQTLQYQHATITLPSHLSMPTENIIL